MKRIFLYALSFIMLSNLLTSCMEDSGTYEYDYENATILKIDTIGKQAEYLMLICND